MAVLGLPCCVSLLWLWGAATTLQLRCTGFSLRRLFLQWSVGFRVLGLQWFQHRGSVVAVFRLRSAASAVVAQGLSCSTVCGIFPDQGLNPMFPTLAGRLFTTESPGKPCFKILNKSLCKGMLQPFASFSKNLKREKNNSIQGGFFRSSDPLINSFLWLVLQEPSHLS